MCGLLGESGDFFAGSVMALVGDRLVVASENTQNEILGVLAESRIVLDVATATEAELSAVVYRRGSFRARALRVAEGSSLENMARTMRDKGLYIEGLRTVAASTPPFWLKKVDVLEPAGAAVSGAVVLRCTMEGQVNQDCIIQVDGQMQTAQFIDYAHLEAGYTGAGAGPKSIRVNVIDGKTFQVGNSIVVVLTGTSPVAAAAAAAKPAPPAKPQVPPKK